MNKVFKPQSLLSEHCVATQTITEKGRNQQQKQGTQVERKILEPKNGKSWSGWGWHWILTKRPAGVWGCAFGYPLAMDMKVSPQPSARVAQGGLCSSRGESCTLQVWLQESGDLVISRRALDWCFKGSFSSCIMKTKENSYFTPEINIQFFFHRSWGQLLSRKPDLATLRSRLIWWSVLVDSLYLLWSHPILSHALGHLLVLLTVQSAQTLCLQLLSLQIQGLNARVFVPCCA